MLKKILIILVLVVITGCTMNINKMLYEEIIDSSIKENIEYSNIDGVGFKYYLPINFSLYKDDKYNQILLSNNTYY